LDKAIRDFHDSVDTIEIAKQLSGATATDVLALPTVVFEIRERATVAGMLFKPFEDEKARIKFIRALARLRRRQETAKRTAAKRKKSDFVIFQGNDTHSKSKRRKRDARNTPELSMFEADENKPVESLLLYPTVLPLPVCLICIGNKEFTYKRRMHPVPQKDVLKKHVEAHFQLPEY
jgi:hypothetical protein